MSEIQEIGIIEKFFFNDEILDAINQINNHLKPNNIFEITGMGSQEIKHSKILGWFMSSNHEIKDYFFVNLLKYAISFTDKQKYFDNKKIKDLKEYIYILPQKNFIVKFEYKNIDILVIDEANKFVFVIENKVGAQESKEQLAKYREIAEEEFRDYKRFGIFLTADGSLPDNSSRDSESNLAFYLIAWYKDIYSILKNILEKDNITLTNETHLIIENYMDLLLRRNIVENEEIKEICEKIWSNEEYKSALEILLNYKPSKLEFIRDYLKGLKNFQLLTEEINGRVNNFFFKLDESGYIFRITYSKEKGLSFSICANEKSNLTMNNKSLYIAGEFIIKPNKTIKTQYKYNVISGTSKLYSDEEITDDLLDKIIEAFREWLPEN
ncbi:MAG: hypothetical protein KN64_09660 [Sulfurovum sp. AS07-7]|nr:MAG: hypothetical protein KN64_09660 [Sulfurovum sp. AS07-7]